MLCKAWGLDPFSPDRIILPENGRKICLFSLACFVQAERGPSYICGWLVALGTLWEPRLFKEEAKRAGSIRGAEMDEALAEVGWAAGMQRCRGRAAERETEKNIYGRRGLGRAGGEAGAPAGYSRGCSLPRTLFKSRDS